MLNSADKNTKKQKLVQLASHGVLRVRGGFLLLLVIKFESEGTKYIYVKKKNMCICRLFDVINKIIMDGWVEKLTRLT